MAFRLSPHLTVMANAAQKAAKRLLRDFSEVEQLQVSVKGPSDFVSQADIRAEQTLKEELNKARPGYSFLMEESGASGSENWTWRWIVDPLDGTTNFLHGMPHWAISIGLERRLPDGSSEIHAGLIYAPAADEMFWAEKGAGAFMNERRLRVSARREMSEAVFATGIPFGAVSAPRRQAFSADVGGADAAGGRGAPVRRRGAGPGLGRAWPVRRLLGTGDQAMGYRSRRVAGARGRRLRDGCRRRQSAGDRKHRGGQPASACQTAHDRRRGHAGAELEHCFQSVIHVSGESASDDHTLESRSWRMDCRAFGWCGGLGFS